MSPETLKLIIAGSVLNVLAYPVLLVLHEACHVAGGVLVGFRPRVVRIGRAGRLVLRIRAGAVEWLFFQKFWTGGDTQAIAKAGRSPLRWAAFHAAGPIGSVFLGVGMWWATSNHAVRAFGVANVLTGCVSCSGGGESDAAKSFAHLRSWWRSETEPSPAPARVIDARVRADTDAL